MGIYVWGTGCGAAELMEQGMEIERITAFVDSYPNGDSFLGKRVLLPEQLDIKDCELLIITARQADAIAARCNQLGIPEEKCLYLKNHTVLLDRNRSCKGAEAALGRELLQKLLPKQRAVTVPAQLAEAILPERDLSNDYVRLATLELLCRRMEDVPGAAAELGVYRGFFASCVNRLLPDRYLYLFDSFEGFAPEDRASAAFQAAHRNTAAEMVLSGMPCPKNGRVKPGFFPQSLKGLEEQFCLVSLDVDFENTTLEGLRYFWPRLSRGGYLLLHDWGNPKLPGVERALERYETELGEKLAAVPLCDVGGTLVLCKP